MKFFLYSSSLLSFIIGIAATTILTRYSSIPQIIKGFNIKKWMMSSFGLYLFNS